MEVKIPVSVELSGEKPSPDEDYTMTLEGRDGAPMPEKSSLTIKGAGKEAFPAISYSVPGIYCYTVTQQPGKQAEGHYDSTVYYVKVSITNGKNGNLEAVVAAHTDAQMVSKKQEISFKNTYDAVKKPTPTPTPKPTPSSSSTPSSTPRTGDNTNFGLWIGLIAVSAGAVLVLFYVGRKKKKKTDH